MSTRAVLLAVLTLAACDDDNPARHLDGGTVDSPTAMIDAPSTPNPVTLTVTFNGIPQAGIVVHFQNADSTLVATEMTDSIGVASHVMAAGGYVTAVDPFVTAAGLGTSSQLRTFAGVKPGDHLKLTAGFNAPSTIDMTVTLPVQADTQTVRYLVTSTCSPSPRGFTSSGSGSQPSGAMSFDAACTTADILAVKYDVNSGVVGYIFVADQAITANGTLDYSSKSYATPTPRTYTFNNKPQTMASINIEQHLGNSPGELANLTGSTTGMPDATTIGIPTLPNSVGVLQAGARNGMSYHSLLDWGPVATTPYTTDMGARKLVDISNAGYDVATHSITWTEGSGAVPQLDFVELFATRSTTTMTFGLDWRVVAPHVAGSLMLPVVPVGAVDYNIDADDNVDINILSFMKLPGGYDAIRANGFTLEDIVAFSQVWPLLATGSGSAEVVMYAPIQPEFTARTTLRHRARR